MQNRNIENELYKLLKQNKYGKADLHEFKITCKLFHKLTDYQQLHDSATDEQIAAIHDFVATLKQVTTFLKLKAPNDYQHISKYILMLLAHMSAYRKLQHKNNHGNGA